MTQTVLALTLEHAALVALSVAFACLIGIPAGIALTRSPRVRPVLMSVVNMIQTIPSLALFGFLIPLPLIGGIGRRTAIVALTLYALLPIMRNTLTGILGVDHAVREAGLGMGMTGWQMLRMVELPLSSRAILSGIRIAITTTIGTATIAAAIGGGGLGILIFRGIASIDTTLLLAGAIPAACMALLADGLLDYLERLLPRPH